MCTVALWPPVGTICMASSQNGCMCVCTSMCLALFVQQAASILLHVRVHLCTHVYNMDKWLRARALKYSPGVACMLVASHAYEYYHRIGPNRWESQQPLVVLLRTQPAVVQHLGSWCYRVVQRLPVHVGALACVQHGTCLAVLQPWTAIVMVSAMHACCWGSRQLYQSNSCQLCGAQLYSCGVVHAMHALTWSAHSCMYMQRLE
jgi:hypothetical protein